MKLSPNDFSDTKNTRVEEVGFGVVSPHVRFIFTHPIEIKAGQMIELDNAQWFLREWLDGEINLIQLDGKWAT
jgi:hypothetical protein